MGEIADMILEGELCQYCGVYLHGSLGAYPQSCAGCQEPKVKKRPKAGRPVRPLPLRPKKEASRG